MRNDRSATARARSGRALAGRGFTAVIGGYAAAAAASALAARLLPITRLEATLWAMLASFLVYAGFALWAFRARSVTRVMGVTWGVAAVCGGALFLLGTRP